MTALTWHQKPDDAVREKCRHLAEIRATRGEAAYIRILREVLKTDIWFMIRVALEWGWLDEDLVGRSFVKHIAEHPNTDKAILLPRGFGKTLPMSAVVVNHIINHPDCAILQVSRTDDNALKFGDTVAQHLMYNPLLQKCFGIAHNPTDGILPSSKQDTSSWGKDGYNLPKRKPRFDPTLLCLSINSAVAGKHPDWIYIDDPTEAQNNNERGWEQVRAFIDNCKLLLGADGYFIWTGTRWHDADPLGSACNGKLFGKQGAFRTIQYSCFTDDNPAKPPTYARKKRWNMTKETGYTNEALERLRLPEDQGGLGVFFDAQMRNDPKPADRADIKVSDIVIYNPDEKEIGWYGEVRAMGIEITGGGLPILNGLRERCENIRISMPIVEISNPRKQGVTKRDRIVAAIQPITSSGRLYAPDWMIGDERRTDGLGYELRRLGAAAHDDICDALHNCIVHLVRQTKPAPDEPAHLYIAVDLAYSEEKRSDWTVAFALAVDHKQNYYCVDYDRFQLSSPTGIYDRLISFYRKFEEPQSIRTRSRRKYPGAWR